MNIKEKDDSIILEQALDWLLLMDENGLSETQKIEFEQWKNLSIQHQKNWQKIENVQNKLKQNTEKIPKSIARDLLTHQKITQILPLNLMLIMICSVVIASIYFAHEQAWTSDYSTTYGEQKEILLNDGTKIHLNSKTAIDVQYGEKQRNIILKFGEIYVETGKDEKHRPFTVLNKDGAMLALGTAFDVRQENEFTTLSVTQHSVEATTQSTNQKIKLETGYSMDFNKTQFYPKQKINIENMLWRHSLMMVDRMDLAEFSKIIEKNYGLKVEADTTLSHQAELKISGTYPMNDLERLITLLEDTYGLEIKKNIFGNKLLIKKKI